MARSAENFDADSEAEVAGETDMEVDIEKGERCTNVNVFFVVNTSRFLVFHLTCIYVCVRVRSASIAIKPLAVRRHVPPPHKDIVPECHSQSATPRVPLPVTVTVTVTCVVFTTGSARDGEELRG